MPTSAQDRIRRGPVAALLILLSLVLSSGAAAAGGGDIRGSARLGPSRHGVAAALLPSSTRNPLDDEAPGTGVGASLPPAGPGLVTRRLWSRPLAEGLSGGPVAPPKPATASYRARAPPAS